MEIRWRNILALALVVFVVVVVVKTGPSLRAGWETAPLQLRVYTPEDRIFALVVVGVLAVTIVVVVKMLVQNDRRDR